MVKTISPENRGGEENNAMGGGTVWRPFKPVRGA